MGTSMRALARSRIRRRGRRLSSTSRSSTRSIAKSACAVTGRSGGRLSGWRPRTSCGKPTSRTRRGVPFASGLDCSAPKCAAGRAICMPSGGSSARAGAWGQCYRGDGERNKMLRAPAYKPLREELENGRVMARTQVPERVRPQARPISDQHPSHLGSNPIHAAVLRFATSARGSGRNGDAIPS
jgi:hypothetical protein